MSRILIIEDDNHVRSMLRQMLKTEGYEILEASDGAEGLNIYSEEPTDLVITDIIMEKKEGIETIRELRQDFPEVKIIAMSGGGRAEPTLYLDLAKRLGEQEILNKPFERKELLEAIHNIL